METVEPFVIQKLDKTQRKWLKSVSGTLDKWYQDSWYKPMSVERWIKEVLDQGYYVKKSGINENKNYDKNKMD